MILINFIFLVTGYPSPQGSVHGQPQAGTISTPGPPAITGGQVGGVGGIRRNRAGWREWRRADPTLINSLWKSKMGHGIRSQLGTKLTHLKVIRLVNKLDCIKLKFIQKFKLIT